MKRFVLAAAVATFVMSATAASAGEVCVNHSCAKVAEASAQVWADLDSRIAFTAQLLSGPKIGTTGIVNIEAEPNDVGITPTVNGWSWGRTGVSHDQEHGSARVCLSQVGCQNVAPDASQG